MQSGRLYKPLDAIVEPGLEAWQLLEITGPERASCPVGIGVACRTGSPPGCLDHLGQRLVRSKLTRSHITGVR